jgi:hypothetical protein
MQIGLVVYGNVLGGSLVAPIADNGLSVTASVIMLGGPLGTAGPATLLNNREIPFSTFGLYFTGLAVAAGQGQLHLRLSANDLPAVPMILFESSAGAEFARLTITSVRDMYFGLNAGANVTALSLQNVVMGGNSAAALTNGNNNTFMGWQSGNTLTTGSGNVAIGANAMVGPTAGTSNCVAVGSAALGNTVSAGVNTANVAIGTSCCQQQPMGLGTIGVGFKAAFNQGDGGSNIYIGYQCWGVQIIAGGIGSGNIFIGANQTSTGGFGPQNNCILIGAGINTTTTNISNTTILGNSYGTTVSNICVIGVGTSGQNTLVGPGTNQADLGSTLQVFGSLAMPIVETAVNYTLLARDFTVIATAAGLTFTCPTAATFNKRIICYVAQSPGTITLSVGYTSLAGVAGVTAIAAGTSVWVQSDGTVWNQIK